MERWRGIKSMRERGGEMERGRIRKIDIGVYGDKEIQIEGIEKRKKEMWIDT